MKKLLSLLGMLTMTTSIGTTIVACDSASSKTSLDNPALVNADFGLNTHLFEDVRRSGEHDLEVFDEQMRGYINPILYSILNRNIENIDREYTIIGPTLNDLENAIDIVDHETTNDPVHLSGVTVRSTPAATILNGSTTLRNVLIVKGWDINSIFDGEISSFVVPIAGYNPTFEEIVNYLNRKLKPAVERAMGELHGGHFYFEKPQRGLIGIYGQGYLYNSIKLRFLSALAQDISTVIRNTNLGEIPFRNVPTEAQVIQAINQVNGLNLNINDIRIDNISKTGGTVHGLWYYKGTLELSWVQAQIDLSALQETNLGHLDHQPTEQEVVDLINAKNDNLGLLLDDLTMEFDGQQIVVTAKPDNAHVRGSVTVTWGDTRALEQTIVAANQALADNQHPNPNAERRLRNAIFVAQTVLDDDTAPQGDIDDAVRLLQEAIDRFELATQADYTNLIAAIATARQAIIDNINPNPDAQATLNAAIVVAQNVVNRANSTQAQVDAATATLNTAIQDFQDATRTDYSQLLESIQDAQNALDNNENPNPDAEAALGAAITDAQEVANNPDATQAEVDDATQALTEAIQTFHDATKADYTNLVAAIANANQALADNVNPNPDAEATLNAAITIAQNIVDEADSSQTEVDQAVITLNEAIQDFKTATATNYSPLTAAITTAQAAIEANVNPNPDAEATLNAAITISQNIVDEANSTQVQVDAATATLNDAIQDFQDATRTDYSQLLATIQAAQTAITDNVNPNPTAEAVLNDAITAAQDVIDNPTATQVQVNNAIATLNVAIQVFKTATATDYSELSVAITTAQAAISANVNPNPAAEATLNASITSAQNIVNDANSSQDEVDLAVIGLGRATAVFKEATDTNYSQLAASINIAHTAIANNKNPNPEAEADLNAAITTAQGVLDNPRATQVQVNNAVATLNTAIQVFRTSTATDYSQLVTTIAAARQALADNENPNPDAEADLNVAINVATSVRNNVNASQVDVDQAVEMLEGAIQDFKDATASPDFSVLRALIVVANSAIARDAGRHPIAASVLRLAITAAEVVANNILATQAEINLAVDTLQAAINVFLNAIGGFAMPVDLSSNHLI